MRNNVPPRSFHDRAFLLLPPSSNAFANPSGLYGLEPSLGSHHVIDVDVNAIGFDLWAAFDFSLVNIRTFTSCGGYNVELIEDQWLVVWVVKLQFTDSVGACRKFRLIAHESFHESSPDTNCNDCSVVNGGKK